MTREELMKLQTYKMYENEETVYVERDDVLKLLEQQPCYNPDEWCKTCKEYDHDKHCCPRYNGVIRKAVEEMKQPKTGHWIYEKRKRLINETDEGAEYVTDYWCKCSKCNGDFGYRKMKDAFCKYCGAKMINVPDINDGKIEESEG